MTNKQLYEIKYVSRYSNDRIHLGIFLCSFDFLPAGGFKLYINDELFQYTNNSKFNLFGLDEIVEYYIETRDWLSESIMVYDHVLIRFKSRSKIEFIKLNDIDYYD
jgi:hypothetical protein